MYGAQAMNVEESVLMIIIVILLFDMDAWKHQIVIIIKMIRLDIIAFFIHVQMYPILFGSQIQ